MTAKKILILMISILMVILLYACNSSSDDGNINANNNTDRSLPVRVERARPSEFYRELNYSAILEGSVQSEARSNVGGVLNTINVRIGESVKKDQIIASFDEDLPASGFLQAESAFHIARTTYERMKNLHQAGGISRQQLDEAETQYRIAKVNYEAAKKNINVLAPIDGIISNINFRVGDNIIKGQAIASIVDFSQLNCRIWVDDADISGFYEGLEVIVSWRGHESEFTGRVDRVAMSANPQRRAFEVEIGIDNRENKLKPGIMVEVRANIFRVEDAIVIPKLIIQQHEGRDVVYIVRNNIAYRRPIRTGIESGSLIEVREGIMPGDWIVTEGQFSLTDRARVRGVK